MATRVPLLMMGETTWTGTASNAGTQPRRCGGVVKSFMFERSETSWERSQRLLRLADGVYTVCNTPTRLQKSDVSTAPMSRCVGGK
jgi:hypothetical protein